MRTLLFDLCIHRDILELLGYKLGHQNLNLVRELGPDQLTHCTGARKFALVSFVRWGRYQLFIA